MNGKKKNNTAAGGFSLIELMVTMTIFLFILYSVFIMINHYGDVTRTEYSRMRLQQESRYMMSAFASELKEAGSMLTLAHTGSYLSTSPYFNGIFPLNMANFPDGIIVATGDPEAATKLTMPMNGSDTVLSVESAVVPGYDASLPLYENEILPWRSGDRGIVIGSNGYLVFSVRSADTVSNSITIRGTPVYYSGLLNTTASPDGKQYIDVATIAGNNVTYPVNAPVIRLANFSIYLFREVLNPDPERNRNIRQLIRLSDAVGQPDVLADGSQAQLNIISENIWDMQISYIAFEKLIFSTADRTTAVDPAHYYFAGTDPSISSSVLADLLVDFRQRRAKQINVTIVSLTDEFPGRGEEVHRIRAIGDQPAYLLPRGKFGYKILSLSIEPKNYNIIL